MKEVQQLGEPRSDTDVDLGSSVLGEAIQSKKPAFAYLPIYLSGRFVGTHGGCLEAFLRPRPVHENLLVVR